MFPRVVVRERTISGEPSAWYVYRDGGWRPPPDSEWWSEPSLPRIVVTSEGFLVEVSPTAAGLLGIDPVQTADHHFTDFIVPGTLDDSMALFRVVQGGDPITATMLMRTLSGEFIAVDLHAAKQGDQVVGTFRMAANVEVPDQAADPGDFTAVTKPASDVAFRSYVLRALRRMPEPTLDGLALRIHRLYPHAVVARQGDEWTAEREPHVDGRATDQWWLDPSLPRVRYDSQALILDASESARDFLGHELVGHHWQDFVTPGTTDEVAVMLDILAKVGAAESRFRMPRADGRLVEFDSFTTVEGEEFVTVMRPATPAESDSQGA